MVDCLPSVDEDLGSIQRAGPGGGWSGMEGNQRPRKRDTKEDIFAFEDST